MNGIHLSISSFNHLSDNILKDNDSNSINATAGLYIEGDSDKNVIIGNSILDNNNSGVGNGYGIYIKDSDGDRNTVQGNQVSGNDIQYLDNGINTDIIYRCSSNTEIQDAIDSIASKSGLIKILSANISITSTLIINNVSAIITIEGNGFDTILTLGGDYPFITISAAKQVIIKQIKIDATALSTTTTRIINFAANDVEDILIDTVQIVGDGTNGIGIYIEGAPTV